MADRRRILVACGTSELGAIIANRLAAHGDCVSMFGICSGSSSNDRIEAHIEGNAAVAADRVRLVELLSKSPPGLDGLVVAIGDVYTARLSETKDEAWDAVIEANLIAPTLFAQSCLPLFKNGGSIVFIGSAAAQWPEMELGAYSVAKRMLERMAQVLAMEAALMDVRVNVINPGEMGVLIDENAVSSLRKLPHTPVPPLGRQVEPDDVVGAVTYFLSDGAAACTAASLTIDGGTRAALRSHKVRQ